MEQYVEEIEVSDELAAGYKVSSLNADDLIKILECFDYSTEQAIKIVKENHATIINDLTGIKLYEAFITKSYHLLPLILRPVKLEIIFVDDCQLLFLKLPQTPSLDEGNINWIRVQLGPYYPDKIRSHTLTITTPNGKQLRLGTYDLLQAHQFDQIFEHYRQWYKHQSKWIAPKFDKIGSSLGDWLKAEVTKGIQLQKDEFINWFINNRLGVLTLDLELTFDKENGYIIPGSKVPIKLTINNLAKHFTPNVMEQDIIEFGFWKVDQIENIKQKVLAKRALVHQNQKDENSIILQNEYLQIFNSETEAYSCLVLMQKWNLINIKGENKIGQREKYRLMAFVEVLQQKCLLPPSLPTASLTTTIAKQIQMPYQRARSGDRKNYDSAMRDYLNKLNAISFGLLTWPMLVDNGR